MCRILCLLLPAKSRLLEEAVPRPLWDDFERKTRRKVHPDLEVLSVVKTKIIGNSRLRTLEQ